MSLDALRDLMPAYAKDISLNLGSLATETVLKNQPKNQFATRVELSGSVHQQDISAFEAFLQILRNGFVQAFNARYEQAPPKQE